MPNKSEIIKMLTAWAAFVVLAVLTSLLWGCAATQRAYDPDILPDTIAPDTLHIENNIYNALTFHVCYKVN